MKLVVASDERNKLTDFVLDYLKSLGYRLCCQKIRTCFAEPCLLPNGKTWDDANILCMALVNTKEEVAKEMVDVFFKTEFNEEGLNEARKLDE